MTHRPSQGWITSEPANPTGKTYVKPWEEPGPGQQVLRWTPDLIREFQQYYDGLMPNEKHRQFGDRRPDLIPAALVADRLLGAGAGQGVDVGQSGAKTPSLESSVSGAPNHPQYNTAWKVGSNQVGTGTPTAGSRKGMFAPTGGDPTLELMRGRVRPSDALAGILSWIIPDLPGHEIGVSRDALRHWPNLSPGTENDPTAERMAVEWALGKGPRRRTLGPDSQFTQAFRNSPGIERIRQDFYTQFGPNPDPGSTEVYDPTFDWEFFESGTTWEEHFLGSYTCTVTATET